MAKCEGCFGQGQTLMSVDHRWPVGKAEAAWLVTCPTCGGTGDLSCCEGVLGDGLETPPDPLDNRDYETGSEDTNKRR